MRVSSVCLMSNLVESKIKESRVGQNLGLGLISLFTRSPVNDHIPCPLLILS